MKKSKQIRYSELLKDIFKPKTKEDYKKLEDLEKLMVEFILIRTVEDMEVKKLDEFEKKDFKSSEELAVFLKHEVPNFDLNLNKYINEFLKTYVRNR